MFCYFLTYSDIFVTEATLIYPHQLFAAHPGLRKDRPVILVEEPLFMGTDPQYPIAFHKQKLILHRASMRAYQSRLSRAGYRVWYLPVERLNRSEAVFCLVQEILSDSGKTGIDRFIMADPVDYALEKRLLAEAKRLAVTVTMQETPGFLTSKTVFDDYFDSHQNYRMAEFYTWQRKRLGILLTPDGKPEGGSWSYDHENRKKLPREIAIPPVPDQVGDTSTNAEIRDWVAQARTFVRACAPDNPGSDSPFSYPITHEEAEDWLDRFLAQRLEQFGPYEDSFAPGQPFLFHSVLSPMLNIGLLTPEQVIDRTLERHQQQAVPLSSLEGFLRQIIGWREYMRALYVREGVRMRTSNTFGHTKTLSEHWYNGSTGLDPVDDTIKQVQQIAYTHHIPRLMIIGNSMLLAEIDPSEVYRWFMELFIDAYDWVMVPNVYAMSQFSDGGLITTKPYISSSNYLTKMGRYPPGDWCDTWDALFWRFVIKHQTMFAGQGRMQFVARQAERMAAEKKSSYIETAETFDRKTTS